MKFYSLSPFGGFFQVQFQEMIKKLQIHLVLGFSIPSFQMISITSRWSHYFFFLSSHPNRLQKVAATITDSNEKLPNSGTLLQFCNLEVGFLEIDQQQQQQQQLQEWSSLSEAILEISWSSVKFLEKIFHWRRIMGCEETIAVRILNPLFSFFCGLWSI